MQILPNFTEEQREFVVEYLIMIVPYKNIAMQFRELYPDFAPEVDNETYIEKFTARCRQYVADKRQKWAKIIAEARKEYRDSVDHVLVTHPRYRMEQRQATYDELGDIVEKMLATTDRDKLNSLKLAATVLVAKQKVIDTYEKGLRDQQKIDNAGGSGNGITLPVTEER